MPMPPAISSAFSRRRTALGEDAERPLGDDARARPRARASRPVWSPSALTVMRSDSPSGAAESENGCAVHQRRRSRKRQRKNCPACARSRSSLRPVIRSETTPGPFGHDLGDAQPVPQRAAERHEHAEDDEHDERGDVERAPVVGGGAVEDELVAGRDLVEPRERDACVRQQVHDVPPLVAEPAPHDHERGRDDGDQHPRADGRGDHPGVDAAPSIVEISFGIGSLSISA